MKSLSVYGLAILLVLGTSAALAKDRHHDKRPHHEANRHHAKHYGKHHNKHNRRYYSHGYYKPYKHSGWKYGWNHGYRYYRPHYPNYVGAALLGSALNYSLYHSHQGVACYDRHDNVNYSDRSYSDRSYSNQNYSNSQVVGCHRIERRPDGTEVRVEVPMDQCY